MTSEINYPLRVRSGIYSLWNDTLTESEIKIVSDVSTFCSRHIAPLVEDSVHSKNHLPREIVKKWGSLGLPGLQTPVALGGLGASYMAKICMVQEIARYSFACAFSLNNMQSLVLSIATRASPQVRERYLPDLLTGNLIASVALTEPGGGSDLAAMTTSAVKVDGGWTLTGEKAWIGNAAFSDLAVVSAQAGSGTKGVGRFIVDLRAPGVERLPPHRVAAGHLAGLGGFRLKEYFVPDEYVMDPPGDAFKLAMQSINGARTHIAAMCVASAEVCLSTAIRYGSQRTTFGKRLLDHQGLRWQLANVANKVEAANLLVFHSATLIHEGKDATLAAAHAKKFAAEMAIPAIEACMQTAGANGTLADNPFSRHMAEIKLAAYADGTTEMQNERIGSFLEKHYAN